MNGETRPTLQRVLAIAETTRTLVEALERKLGQVDLKSDETREQLVAVRTDLSHVRQTADALNRFILTGENGAHPIAVRLSNAELREEDLCDRLAAMEQKAKERETARIGARAQMVVSILSGVFALGAAAIALLK